MGNAAQQFATYEDVLTAPEHLVAEILHGVLETHPRPSPKHTRTASALGGSIWQPFDAGSNGPGGWWIMDEPELHLGYDIMVPDLAGWQRSRMPQLPDTAWFKLEPDWVCEILSPATARVDRAIKMPLYAKYKVAYLWLIDPLLQTLEAYQRQGNQWILVTTLSKDDSVQLAPFDAVGFPLQSLWS